MDRFGLYIHVPFCLRKCYYCDFNSVSFNEKLSKSFLNALNKEIDLLAQKYNPSIRTIFIGGGTPTILGAKELRLILDKCYNSFKIEKDIEITIETNPGTLDEKKLSSLKEGGVDRLSFGVQAFDDDILKRIGRIHTVEQAVKNYYLARKIGFDNISLDLIFNLPGQTLKDWEGTLKEAMNLDPEHLSTYNLKIEEETKFYSLIEKGELTYPDEDLDLEMYNLSLDILKSFGYEDYEISNFAKRGYRSKHNQIYWKNEGYLGVGPGAHFYDGSGRGSNLRDVKEYSNSLLNDKLPIENYNKLSKEDEIEEEMILGLRLKEGVSISDFNNKYKRSIFDIYGPTIKILKTKGLLEVNERRVFLTPKGRLLANRVLADFILT
ncbi:radical SAM family heme chaperone HemW [Halonatronum saccharophilum]|uniref:radical SAM family heme chaperone HemW n=1 Tax=Halonatronum saccharophilum TaxID=150060 RepID=UPI00047FB247|nr:radical SAM family heme chaperone HemW [Halonatronum saccharophilum]